MVDVDLHPHLPLEHGRSRSRATLVLQPERHRAGHVVLEVSDLKQKKSQKNIVLVFEKRQR